MRPATINLPGSPLAARSRFIDKMRRGTAKAEFRFLARDGRELQRPAIQGWAVLHERALEFEGEYVYFEAGAFAESLADNTTKHLLLNHDAARSYGSTTTGLELYSTAEGLAYRLPLSGEDGRAVYDGVMGNDRACVSVGCVFEKTSKRKMAGLDVLAIAKASLKEISLCRQGKVPETCATVVDLEEENPYLWLAARSPAFGSAKAVANATARAKRITDALRSEF